METCRYHERRGSSYLEVGYVWRLRSPPLRGTGRLREHTGMPSRSGLLDRVEIVAHAVDAAAGGRDDIVENSLGTGNTGSMATARKSRALIGWHLDEMVVRIAGKRMYLWRAVDHEGEVLDMLVQSRRDSRAALRLMRKLLRKQGFVPKLLVTDKL